MTSVESQIELVKTLVSDISGLVGTLSSEQLALPSACAEWQVQDVVSHLVGGAERQIDSMRRGRAGDAGPPEGFTPLESSAMSSTNAQRDIQRRQQLAGGLVPAFDEFYDRLYQEMDGFNPDGWDIPCWHLRRGAMPAADYVELRIQELAIHDWDIRKALEPEPSLHPDSIDPLLSMAPKWLRMCFRPGEKLDAPILYEFDLAPPHETSIVVRVAGDSFEILSAGEAPEDRWTVCAEAPTFLLFIYGRLTGQKAISANEFAISGDSSLLERFESWFKGV